MKKILNQENLMIVTRILFWAIIIDTIIFYNLPQDPLYIKYYNAAYHAYIWLFCSWVAVVVLKNILQLFFKAYRSGGSKEKWYKETMKWMGTDWMAYAADNLISKGLIPNNDIIMASPSANAGIYEKELFNHICDKKIKTIIVASDLEDILLHERSINRNLSKYIYVDGKHNAIDIKKTLASAGITEKIDAIWDIKGCLWYNIPAIFFSKKARLKIIEALVRYQEVLKDNGMIIIDSIPASILQLFLYYVLYLLVGRFGNGEESTFQRLNKLLWREDKYCKMFNRKPILSEYIQEHFQIQKFDFINKKNKKISYVCLIKQK